MAAATVAGTHLSPRWTLRIVSSRSARDASLSRYPAAPAFNAFKLLHRLGETRIPANADDIIATRRADGAIVIAVWNTPVVGGGGESKEVVLQLNSLKGRQKASVYRVDADHGSLLKAYASMGSPVYPTSAQIQTLRQAAQLPKPETMPIRNGQIALHLAPDALVLLEVR